MTAVALLAATMVLAIFLWYVGSCWVDERTRARAAFRERQRLLGIMRSELMIPPPMLGGDLDTEIAELASIAENVEALRTERETLVSAGKRTEELLKIAQREREKFHLELMEKFGVKERAKLYRTIEDAVRDLRRLRAIEETVNDGRK